MRFLLIAFAAFPAHSKRHKLCHPPTSSATCKNCLNINMDSYDSADGNGGFEFDFVREEKAIAMRNYRRNKKFKSFLMACVALAPVLFALSRSSAFLTAASDCSGAISFLLNAVFDNRFYVFAIVLALIVGVSVSLRQKDDGEADSGVVEAARSSVVYDEFALNSVYSRSFVFDGGLDGQRCVYQEPETTPYYHGSYSPETESPPYLRNGAEDRFVYQETETTPNCQEVYNPETESTLHCHEVYNRDTETTAEESSSLQITCFPSVVESVVVTQTEINYVPPFRSINANCMENDVASAVVSKEKPYRRSQSEIFENQRVEKHSESPANKKIMQRSETEIHRKTVSCGEEPTAAARRSNSVDEMNDEEFNQQIQNFILKNKMKQKQEIECDKEERRRIEKMEEERRRRGTEEENHINMSSFISSVIH